jgi:hypothetical protein
MTRQERIEALVAQAPALSSEQIAALSALVAGVRDAA